MKDILCFIAKDSEDILKICRLEYPDSFSNEVDCRSEYIVKLENSKQMYSTMFIYSNVENKSPTEHESFVCESF